MKNNIIYFRIWKLANTDFVSEKFTKSLNDQAFKYFKGVGVSAKALSPPQLGAGEPIHLIIKFIKVIISVIARAHRSYLIRNFDSISPQFKIYLFSEYHFENQTIWDWEDTTSTTISELIFHAYQLNQYLLNYYENYKFQTEIVFRSPQFKYMLNIEIPYYYNEKIFFSKVSNFVQNLSLKGNLSERVIFSKFLTKQNLQKISADGKIISEKTFFYLNGFKSRIFSPKKRGIKLTKHSKGNTIELLENKT